MNTKTTWTLIVILVVISLGASVFFSNNMPATMISHWGTDGQPDGYTSKLSGLITLPIIMILLSVLIMVVPNLDPLKRNIDAFRPQYNFFVLCFGIFFTYLHILTLVYNLGVRMEFVSWMMPAMGLFFIAAAGLIGVAKPNYFIGIRTPWTLSNSIVWEDTHRFGAIAFRICGILCIVSAFFPRYSIYFVLIPILGTVVALYAYSYLRFKQVSNNVQ